MKRKKDIFNYIEKPGIREYRKETCIDKLYDIPDVYDEKKEKSYSKIIIKNILVSDTIKNYKNEVLMTKIQFADAIKYYSIISTRKLNKDDYESYEFLCKMFLEDVVVKLFSIYDKTYHILNSILELKVDKNCEREDYKKKIRSEIKKVNSKLGRKINSIFSKINNHNFKEFRDNIIHNESESFLRVMRDYSIKNENAKVYQEKTIEEILEGIENLAELLNQQLLIIKNLIN